MLTDGRLYIGEHGETFKAFSTLDGHGLKLLAQGGITPVVITGRDSPAVRRRVADLGLAHARLRRAATSWPRRRPLLAALGLDWADAAAIGDDWPDLPLLARAGFRLRAGQRPCRGAGRGRTTSPRRAGGHGAAREFCDLLLMASGPLRRRCCRPSTRTLDAR